MTTDHCMQGGATGFNNSKVIWCFRAGCSTFLQVYFELCWWLNIATVAELTIPENQRICSRFSLKDSPESSKHETSFSAGFYTSNHTDSIASIEMDAFSHKKMRWEWIRMIVASQYIACKRVWASIVVHTGASAQIAICSPYFSVLAEGETNGGSKFRLKVFFLGESEIYLHSLGPRHPFSSLFACDRAPL